VLPPFLSAAQLTMLQLYYTFSALFGWASFSFATISSVQTQSWSLRYKFARLFGQDSDSFAEILTSVHKYVEAVRATPDAAEEAAAPYPCEDTHAAGMALEFRGVTFSYPNSKAKKAAIKDLSITIKPGQLVVIVGGST
jgi:ABC-type multidrug transport system fused ATPase/permease subunit